jgi:hypothetical protein
MENARPLQAEESSAPNSADFTATFPKRHSTVAAEVLRRLLDGERLTGLDAVFDAHTTRLAAVVHYLKRNYGWDISGIDKAVGTVDGRVSEVREYFLPPIALRKAFTAGAADYMLRVLDARARQRAEAAGARTEATRRNASRAVGAAAHG